MHKLGALLFAAIAAQAWPVNAQDGSRAAQGPSAQAVVAQTPSDGADSDATGAIGKGGQPAVTSPVAAQASAQGKPPVSYAEAFRNWRNCAVQHQTVGNPPPQCEALRLALKQAIALRPRYESADARSRN
jgi:hypothetical protein